MDTIDYTFIVALLAVFLCLAYASARMKSALYAVAFPPIVLLAALVLSDYFTRNFFLKTRFAAISLFVGFPAAFLWGAFVLNRKSCRWFACVFSVSAVIIAAVGWYAAWVEPYWIEKTRYTLFSDKITEPVKIAVLADIQMERFSWYEKQYLEEVIKEKPDMILLAGDYLQVFSEQEFEKQKKKFNEYLCSVKFEAPLGVYAVRGNIDSKKWAELFYGTSVKCFEETKTIHIDNFALIMLSCTDSWECKHNFSADKTKYNIVLGHCPDFFMEKYDADLLIAGHEHGSQVRIPFLPPIVMMSSIPPEWITGMIKVSENTHGLVSRGLGLERGKAAQLRFLCRPELAFIEVVPK